MNFERVLKASAGAAAISIALAACGGSGTKGPSALDPANMTPATAVAYAEVAIKPRGSMRSDLIEAVNSIAGSGTAQKLDAKLGKSLGKKGKQFQILAGQRIGVALTALPTDLGGHALTDDAVFVMPTNDPSAARTFLEKNVRQSFESWKVVGHYAIFGGTQAVAAAAATTARTALASDPGFKSDMAQLGRHELFTAYLPLHQLYEQLLPLLSKLPQYSGTGALNGGAKQAPPGSSVALGLSALHNQFSMDVVEHGVPHTSTPIRGVASDVSALPASSWLAITLGGALAKAGTVSKLVASVSKSISTLQAAPGLAGQSIPSGPLQFVVKDLLPALGPAELSVSGSSGTTLQAGLVMAPVDRGAGARLTKAVRHLVSGLPITARTIGGRVAITFGFSNLQQLLNPSSKLADDPTFKHALAQLPSGAKADIYLNFAGIAALAALDPSAGSASAMRVLHRLDYLIAGGTPSHFRLVLATH
jgi:hypothetical protein